MLAGDEEDARLDDEGSELVLLREDNSQLRAQVRRLEILLAASASQIRQAAGAASPPPAPDFSSAASSSLSGVLSSGDAFLEFRNISRLLCFLALPLLFLLLMESATARYTLGGHALASMHLKHLLVPSPSLAPRPPPSGTPAVPAPLRWGWPDSKRLPTRPDTLGGLFVAYRNPRAALRVMRQFREAYPEGDLVIACDDGCYNFSAAAAYFGAHWDARPRRLTTKTDPGWYLRPPNAAAFVRALGDWLPHIRSPRYMVLETDVLIERRVASSLNFTLSGCVCPPKGWFIGGESVYAEKLNPSYSPRNWEDSKVFYGGQGGSIMSTRFMLAIARQPREHLENDLALFFGCSTTVGIDYFISALVHRYNGSIGEYEGYYNWPQEVSAWRFKAGNIEVLHPDKTDYGQPLSPEDLEILGPHWETPLVVDPVGDPPLTPRVHSQCTWEEGVVYRMGDSGLREDALARGEPWPPEGFGHLGVRGGGNLKGGGSSTSGAELKGSGSG